MSHKIPPTIGFIARLERVSYKGEKRWRGQHKRIYTWDELHGELEVFNHRGRHLGAVDPISGDQLKDAVKGRRIDV